MDIINHLYHVKVQVTGIAVFRVLTGDFVLSHRVLATSLAFNGDHDIAIVTKDNITILSLNQNKVTDTIPVDSPKHCYCRNKTLYVLAKIGLIEFKKTKRNYLMTRSIEIFAEKILVGDGIIVAASTKIDLIDIKSWKILKSFTGHATSITDLKISNCGNFLFICSAQDRFITQWPLKSIAYINIQVQTNPKKMLHIHILLIQYRYQLQYPKLY
jgi:WD40 repeat protein